MSPAAADRHRPRPARRRGVPVLALAGLLLLAGCGAGQKAQTYEEKASVDAANVSIGDLALRNVAVSAPKTGTTLEAGSDAPVTVTVVNSGGAPDTLLSASSPAAGSVDVVGGTGRLQVPALGSTGAQYSLVLRSLVKPLDTGTYIDLTLSFAHNGQKTLSIPVNVTDSDKTLPQNNNYKVPDADSNGNPVSP